MTAQPPGNDEEVERMSEQAGTSLGAIRAQQSVLASQHSTAAEADRVLAEALTSAHAATRESIRRLDAIADEIDRAATDRADLAVDTHHGRARVSEVSGGQATRDHVSRRGRSRARSREKGCAGSLARAVRRSCGLAGARAVRSFTGRLRVNCRREHAWVLSPDMEGSRRVPEQSPLRASAPLA